MFSQHSLALPQEKGQLLLTQSIRQQGRVTLLQHGVQGSCGAPAQGKPSVHLTQLFKWAQIQDIGQINRKHPFTYP